MTQPSSLAFDDDFVTAYQHGKHLHTTFIHTDDQTLRPEKKTNYTETLDSCRMSEKRKQSYFGHIT